MKLCDDHQRTIFHFIFHSIFGWVLRLTKKKKCLLLIQTLEQLKFKSLLASPPQWYKVKKYISSGVKLAGDILFPGFSFNNLEKRKTRKIKFLKSADYFVHQASCAVSWSKKGGTFCFGEEKTHWAHLSHFVIGLRQVIRRLHAKKTFSFLYQFSLSPGAVGGVWTSWKNVFHITFFIRKNSPYSLDKTFKMTPYNANTNGTVIVSPCNIWDWFYLTDPYTKKHFFFKNATGEGGLGVKASWILRFPPPQWQAYHYCILVPLVYNHPVYYAAASEKNILIQLWKTNVNPWGMGMLYS